MPIPAVQSQTARARGNAPSAGLPTPGGGPHQRASNPSPSPCGNTAWHWESPLGFSRIFVLVAVDGRRMLGQDSHLHAVHCLDLIELFEGPRSIGLADAEIHQQMPLFLIVAKVKLNGR